MTTLPDRLRIKASMIALGEKISWGSDSEIMNEAADEIERLTTLAQGYLAELVSTRTQRDAYQKVADTMAMAHKVKRDGLALDAIDKQIMIDGQRVMLEKLKAERDELAREVNRLEAVLTDYANHANWDFDGYGIERVWLEPDSHTPEKYHGFELAEKAMRGKK